MKKSQLRRFLLIGCAAIMLATLSGCVWYGGYAGPYPGYYGYSGVSASFYYRPYYGYRPYPYRYYRPYRYYGPRYGYYRYRGPYHYRYYRGYRGAYYRGRR